MRPSTVPELAALRHVTCRYGHDDVLVDVELVVPAGAFIGVV